MHKRIVIGIMLIVTVVFLSSACKEKNNEALQLGSIHDFRTLIAKDSVGFFYFDLKKMRESGILDKFFEDDDILAELDNLEQTLVVDFKKSIEGALMVLLKYPIGKEAQNMGLQYFVISIKPDKKKAIETLKSKAQKELKNEKIGGYTIFHAANINAQADVAAAQSIYLYFKNNDLVFAAWDKNTILTVCQLVDAKKEALDEESDFFETIEKVNHDCIFWGMFTLPESLKKEIAKEPGIMTIPALKHITNIYLGVTYRDKSLLIEANLFTDEYKFLKNLADTLNFVKKVAESYNVQEAEQSTEEAFLGMKIWNKIKVEQEKESVKLSFQMTIEEIESLSNEETTD